MEEMNTTLTPLEMEVNESVETKTEGAKDYILEVNGLKQHFPIKKSVMGKVLSS